MNHIDRNSMITLGAIFTVGILLYALVIKPALDDKKLQACLDEANTKPVCDPSMKVFLPNLCQTVEQKQLEIDTCFKRYK